ncbi:MAG: LPS export ABC transporter permease LptG, partial [Gammaproteobacteria bacterium]|nr:LPS export ABC transporter permease LptG [Gammaproteobacteria bacterium]
MKTIDRYIGVSVLVQTSMVILVLVGMSAFGEFATELDHIGSGKYTLFSAIQYTLMLTPRFAYEMFPLSALLGCMLGLGGLASNSELTVIRASGVSIQRIVLSVLKVGILMMVFVGVLGEFVAPALEKSASIERAKHLSRGVSLNTGDGLWARDENSFLNFKTLLPEGVARDVTLYHFDEGHRLQEIVSANRAIYTKGQWHLQQVNKTTLSAEGIVTSQHKDVFWESTLEPQVMNLAAVKTGRLSAWDLYQFVSYLKANGLESKTYEVSFWGRVLMPFLIIGMVLLAIPFVFGSLRTTSVGQRLIFGVMLGIGFYLFNAIFSRVGVVYDLSPLLSAMLPTVIVFGLW